MIQDRLVKACMCEEDHMQRVMIKCLGKRARKSVGSAVKRDILKDSAISGLRGTRLILNKENQLWLKMMHKI